MLWLGEQMAQEKAELLSRTEKMTSERDRLIKERTTAEKQLRETELKLKEVVDKVYTVSHTQPSLVTVVSLPGNLLTGEGVVFQAECHFNPLTPTVAIWVQL